MFGSLFNNLLSSMVPFLPLRQHSLSLFHFPSHVLVKIVFIFRHIKSVYQNEEHNHELPDLLVSFNNR